MHKLISLYNQNRKKIWVVIISIIIIWFIAMRLINMANDGIKEENNNYTERTEIKQSDFNSISLPSEKSAISNKDITTTKEELMIINNFVEYCNTGKIQEAYALLSDNCKNEMYKTIDDFYKTYYLPLFGKGKKNVSVENWTENIFKVDFNEDILSTGKYSKDNVLQDYITIVSEDGTNKLNINKYIGKRELGITKSVDKITIKIVEKNIYMDYEYYTFEITNNSEKEIALLDTRYSGQSYLRDENDLKYEAAMSELAQEEVTCAANSMKKTKIKYFNRYSTERKITKLEFLNILPDFGIYRNLQDEGDMDGYEELIFEL